MSGWEHESVMVPSDCRRPVAVNRLFMNMLKVGTGVLAEWLPGRMTILPPSPNM